MALRNPGGVRAASYLLALVTVSAAILLAGPPTARADSPNPPWRQQCPQRIALVMDLSESMGPNLDSIKQSASDLIDALRGARNEVAVVAFGTDAAIAVPPTDVGADDQRRKVKEQIKDLTLLEGNLGGTNWEAALTTVGALQPDVVILLTDGQPTAHGQPAVAGSGPWDPEHLAFAVRAAKALQGSGTRVVGLGIGLPTENVSNLAAVTGPTAGDDFYPTDTSGLLGKLYDIASKACGLPVVALPQPEPGTFPLIPIISAGLVTVLAAVIGGILLNRRRSATVVPATSADRPTARPATGPLPDPTITPDLPPSPSIAVGEHDPPAGPAATPADTMTPAPDAQGGRREPRRISLARFQNMDPPHHQGHAGGPGGAEPDGSGGLDMDK
ncbi:MAG TPA: vWA domain-containing protein [Pseudonocardiaceae bacterium]|jgi:hypothetical protein|nr:vWA domain-containing protein [Pseudonocardiaceae bacterium]